MPSSVTSISSDLVSTLIISYAKTLIGLGGFAVINLSIDCRQVRLIVIVESDSGGFQFILGITRFLHLNHLIHFQL